MQRTLHYEGARKTLHEVLRYEVNAVADTQFQFVPGPGTLVYDRDTDTGYQVPDGLDLLETIRDRVRARLDAAPEKQRFRLDDSIHLLLFSLGGAGVYGLCRFVSVLYHRYRRPCHPIP
jgi:hypothetical protein